jgi:hypothetical protein
MDGPDTAKRLFHEIEQYDSSTGELTAWVNIESLSSSTDTQIYIYYGNTQCTNQQFPEMVWDSNYAVVLHMSDATTSTVDDSTSNLNTGYKYSENDPIESDGGKIEKCQEHNSNNNYIRIKDDTSLQIGTEDATMEIWLKTNSELWEEFFYSDDGIDYNKIAFLKQSDEYGCVGQIFIRGDTWSDTSSIRGSTSLNDGEWHYIVGTIDNSQYGQSDEIRLFVDGQEETYSNEKHDWDGTTLSNSRDKWIGSRKNVNKPFQGFLDEFRLSLNERSDAWIETSYNTMNDPSSFSSVGPEESAP